MMAISRQRFVIMVESVVILLEMTVELDLGPIDFRWLCRDSGVTALRPHILMVMLSEPGA